MVFILSFIGNKVRSALLSKSSSLRWTTEWKCCCSEEEVGFSAQSVFQNGIIWLQSIRFHSFPQGNYSKSRYLSRTWVALSTGQLPSSFSLLPNDWNNEKLHPAALDGAADYLQLLLLYGILMNVICILYSVSGIKPSWGRLAAHTCTRRSLLTLTS